MTEMSAVETTAVSFNNYFLFGRSFVIGLGIVQKRFKPSMLYRKGQLLDLADSLWWSSRSWVVTLNAQFVPPVLEEQSVDKENETSARELPRLNSGRQCSLRPRGRTWTSLQPCDHAMVNLLGLKRSRLVQSMSSSAISSPSKQEIVSEIAWWLRGCWPWYSLFGLLHCLSTQ